MFGLIVLFFPIMSWAGVIEIPYRFSQGQYATKTPADPYCASGELKVSDDGGDGTLHLNSEIRLPLVEDRVIKAAFVKCLEHSVTKIKTATLTTLTVEHVVSFERCKDKSEEGEFTRELWTFAARSLKIEARGTDASEMHECSFVRR